LGHCPGYQGRENGKMFHFKGCVKLGVVFLREEAGSIWSLLSDGSNSRHGVCR